MKKNKIKSLISLLAVAGILFTSCENDPLEVDQQNELAEVETKLTAAGFDISNLTVDTMEGVRGYVVEGDIFLTLEDIDALAAPVLATTDSETFEDGDVVRTEHYVTNNLVNGPRTINVFLDPAFSSANRRAFNRALRRYNNLNLELRFRSVNSRRAGNIDLIIGDLPPGVLGRSGGFPRNGNPAPTITLARAFFGAGSRLRADATTIIAHEIGHAIGLRHTDLFDRSFSCGGAPANEGTAGVGANFVRGTPRGPEANSYMLACSNGTDRRFTRGDRRALRRTY